ncbi:SRPBCC family protein [Jannaschia sp. KMU-145]|uniref:SRPBCC family protein n=1 Tax=Jannaschia halovivens TaxID=3388667 RepID=UPI00396B2455
MRLIHRTAIARPLPLVWQVLSRVEDWPDWTPTTRHVRGLDGAALAIGRRFRVRQPLQRERVWRVTHLETGRAFTWSTDGPFGFEALHRLEPSATGCISHVELEAPDHPLLGPILRRMLPAALAAEARGLCRICATCPASAPPSHA